MRRGVHRWLSIAAATGCLASASAPARAQTSGFVLDRFDPAERGSDWFTAESLDLRGSGRLAVGATGDYGYKPLVIYNGDGSTRASVVKHQLFVHVGASVVLFDRLRLGGNLPVALYQDGKAGTLGGATFSSTNATTVGDLRLGADLRLAGAYGGPFTLAFGVQVHLPTGSPSAFTSDGKVWVVPRLLAAGEVGPVAYAARLGFNYRSDGQVVSGNVVGNEISFALAAGLELAGRKLLLGPELYGATGVQGAAPFARAATSTAELLLGAHYRFAGGLGFGVGAGPGLSRGYGEPAARVLLSVEWLGAATKRVEPAPVRAADTDRDHDGVFDKDDACPDTPGERTDDPASNGCPPPDRDHDAILDRDDACPDVRGNKTDDPKTNGCPADRDQDGIVDNEDACPSVPGVKTDDPKTNGCPGDRDGDGVLDTDDACPDQPGRKDPDPKKNGCPAARIEAGQIKIVDQVKFATGSARLLAESDGILNAVLRILNEHPEIGRLGVEGHTDSRGSAPMNLALSKARAASVMKWLIDHGVKRERIESAGFGQTRPIESNQTEEGKKENRRVEFHILPAPPAAPQEQIELP